MWAKTRIGHWYVIKNNGKMGFCMCVCWRENQCADGRWIGSKRKERKKNGIRKDIKSYNVQYIVKTIATKPNGHFRRHRDRFSFLILALFVWFAAFESAASVLTQFSDIFIRRYLRCWRKKSSSLEFDLLKKNLCACRRVFFFWHSIDCTPPSLYLSLSLAVWYFLLGP